MAHNTQPLAKRFKAADQARKREAGGHPQQSLLPMEGALAYPDPTLRKHVVAVHVRTPMTLLQNKTWDFLIRRAQNDLPNKDIRIHSIPIQELAAEIGFDSNNSEYLKSAARALTVVGLEFNLIDEAGVEAWEACTALAGVSIRKGILYFEFSEFLRSKLYQPERYANLYLSDMRALNSVSSYRLYQNVTRYFGIGRTPWLSLPVLRALIGAEAKTYDDFRRLNSKVLGPAIKEINETTRFEIQPNFQYERRSVVGVFFSVSEKAGVCIESEPGAKAVLLLQDEQTTGQHAALLKRLSSEMLLNRDQAEAVLTKHGADRVGQVADYVAKRYLKGGIDNLAGYFLRVVESYDTANSDQKTTLANESDARSSQEQAQATVKKDAQGFKDFWSAMLEDAINELTPAAHEALLVQFQSNLEQDPLALAAFKKEGLEKAFVAGLWRLFAADALLPAKEDAMRAYREAQRSA